MRFTPYVYLVAYDIADPKRLRRVYKIMRGFGDHIQYSVFRCVLNESQLVRMRTRLEAEIKHDEDQVLIVPLGSADSARAWRMTTIGLPLTHPERSVKIF